MTAEAGVFDEAIPRGDPMDAVAEQAAGVANLLVEDVAVRERIRRRREDERMAAPHADVLMMAVTPRQQDVCVMPQEARQRVPHVRERAVISQVWRAAPAGAAAGVRPEHTVVDRVTPKSATDPCDDLANGGHAL